MRELKNQCKLDNFHATDLFIKVFFLICFCSYKSRRNIIPEGRLHVSFYLFLAPYFIRCQVEISISWNRMSVCYSYDTRGPHSTLPKHWQEKTLETRAFFRTMTEPSTLSIDNIREKDEGEYRCRIDYLRSPTKNLRVKLTVIGM